MTAPYWLNRARLSVLENELPHVGTPVGFPRLCGTERAAANSDSAEFAAVPTALRDVPQWVCWAHGHRDGKPAKIPITPKTGAPASVSDSSTWGTFDQAVAAWRSLPGLAGIGFVFAAEDQFCGIDLDDCISDGVIAPAAHAIMDQFSTYTEISPSGLGLKLYLKGKKPAGAGCRSDDIEGFDHVEVYEHGRYFTVTGRSLNGTPHEIADRQSQLDAFCERLWPTPKKRTNSNSTRPTPRPASQSRASPDMVERERRGLAYVEKCPDAISGKGGHNATLRAACVCYRFDLDEASAWRVMQFFNDRKTGGERWSDDELTHKLEAARKKVEAAGEVGMFLHAPRNPDGNDQPKILIDTVEHEVVSRTIAALSADPDIFQRGEVLVRVIRSHDPCNEIVRVEGSATIAAVPIANLRERLTRCATFVKHDRKGQEFPAHPTPWLVQAIDARKDWNGIRRLSGVSDAPVLRPDGSIFQTPGYDDRTGVLYEPAAVFPIIKETATLADAQAAVAQLLDVVCDFRFESAAHRSAWLAGLLTPVARFGFSGPTPLFLVDANIRGAGKGLLAQTISVIVSGREMPVCSYVHDSQEMRKRITSIAIAGDRMILFDNLVGPFGNDAIERALTATRWKDRILGTNADVDLPLVPAWYATGNNVQVVDDMPRRIIHIRLDVLLERPEERIDFKHAKLLAWIAENRGRLLASTLTILTAYIRADCPKQNLVNFGSYEGWSELVRAAVVWVGLPDPCQTRLALSASADTTKRNLSALVDAWRAFDPANQGLVVADVVRRLYPPSPSPAPNDAASAAMRDALEQLIGTPTGTTPDARQIGNKLRTIRRRVVNGALIDSDPEQQKRNGAVWRLTDANQPA